MSGIILLCILSVVVLGLVIMWARDTCADDRPEACDPDKEQPPLADILINRGRWAESETQYTAGAVSNFLRPVTQAEIDNACIRIAKSRRGYERGSCAREVINELLKARLNEVPQ
jgi:hypothetical protein